MHRRGSRAAIVVAAISMGLFACGGESPRSGDDGAVVQQQQPLSGGVGGGRCRLGPRDGAIRHVIYIQFDNTHFMRDDPNVPSDLEQMPHLLDFLTQGGTLLTNHHTPLISHTADDIVTALTGLYADHHGRPRGSST